MESVSSTSEEKSLVRGGSKEYVSMTAEDKDKAEKFMKDLEKSDKYCEGLAARWNVSGKISKTTLIESIRGMISQSSGYSTLLKEMEKPMSKSADAYIHFEELLNDPWMIKNDNDKVTKARLIYHECWSLLFETSTTVNKILVSNKRAIKAIDLYELEIEYQTIPDMSTIDTCLNRVTSWNEACKSLNLLESRFETLGKLVDEQRQEWKKMEQDRKNKFKKDENENEQIGDPPRISIGINKNDGEHIEDVKDAQTNLRNKMANKSPEDNKLIQGSRTLQGITQDFVAIKKDLEELNNACDEFIKHVESCKKEIVDAANGK